MVTITGAQEAVVNTRPITAIPARPDGFPEYSRGYITEGIMKIATRLIAGYGVKESEAKFVAGQVARVFVAHYQGDESLPAGEAALDTRGLGLRARVVIFFRRGLVLGLWRDRPPPDNEVTLDLTTGAAR